MAHYECPVKRGRFCFHKVFFDPKHTAPDEVTPADSDLAYDAMLTHLDEVHGIRGPEAAQMVHQKAVAA